MYMDLTWLHLMFPLAVFLFLGGHCGSTLHSLTFLYNLMAKPVPGFPQFVAMTYVDDQLISFFDSSTVRTHSVAHWIQRLKKDDPDFWRWVTYRALNFKRQFRDDLKLLQRYYNKSEEFHTWQCRHSCEVRDVGYRGGYFQYAYDGREVISLDPETFTCRVADAKAQVLKRRWETDPDVMTRWKRFLEGECPAWLKTFVTYGNETLMRRETPLVKVTRRILSEKQEILTCEVHGFYPREMEATWKRDGEVWEHRTSRRSIAPNSDGTYYAWLSVDIDPTERSRFWCHIDHPSMAEPLVMAWEESGSCHLWIIWEIMTCLFMLAEVLLMFSWFQKISHHMKIICGILICVFMLAVFLSVLTFWIQNIPCPMRIIWEILTWMFLFPQFLFLSALWIRKRGCHQETPLHGLSVDACANPAALRGIRPRTASEQAGDMDLQSQPNPSESRTPSEQREEIVFLSSRGDMPSSFPDSLDAEGNTPASQNKEGAPQRLVSECRTLTLIPSDVSLSDSNDEDQPVQRSYMSARYLRRRQQRDSSSPK